MMEAIVTTFVYVWIGGIVAIDLALIGLALYEWATGQLSEQDAGATALLCIASLVWPQLLAMHAGMTAWNSRKEKYPKA
jgi:hypothetical protein